MGWSKFIFLGGIMVRLRLRSFCSRKYSKVVKTLDLLSFFLSFFLSFLKNSFFLSFFLSFFVLLFFFFFSSSSSSFFFFYFFFSSSSSSFFLFVCSFCVFVCLARKSFTSWFIFDHWQSVYCSLIADALEHTHIYMNMHRIKRQYFCRPQTPFGDDWTRKKTPV